jgi:hypothetical protein
MNPASTRYREMVEKCRSGDLSDDRMGNLKDQVLIYRNRCHLSGILLAALAMQLVLDGLRASELFRPAT